MSAGEIFEVSGCFQARQTGQPVLPAKPEPLTLNPAETAVIVVDLQNAYASKNGYLDKAGFDVSTTAPVIQNTIKVLETARAAGMPVVFLQNGWDADYKEAGGPGSPNWYKSNALKTMRKQPELKGSLLAKGTWDYALVDALKPQDGDIIIPKTRYSGFYNTNLDSMLWNLRCAMASTWNILVWCWPMRHIKLARQTFTRPHFSTFRRFSGGCLPPRSSVKYLKGRVRCFLLSIY